MGLDMYLSKKIYVGANYAHNEVKGSISIMSRGKEIPVNLNKVTYIVESAAYWRKANHIHKWFVDKVQEGNDDCKDYYVSVDNLKELLTTCKEVKESCELEEKEITNEDGSIYKGKIIKNTEIAEKLLPTQKGFFFGGTSYDEYYLQDIEYTIEVIEKILSEEIELNKKGVYSDFEYSSSW